MEYMEYYIVNQIVATYPTTLSTHQIIKKYKPIPFESITITKSSLMLVTMCTLKIKDK